MELVILKEECWIGKHDKVLVALQWLSHTREPENSVDDRFMRRKVSAVPCLHWRTLGEPH